MRVDKLMVNNPSILTVLCGTEDNLVTKHLYASTISTYIEDVIHLNGFVSARR